MHYYWAYRKLLVRFVSKMSLIVKRRLFDLLPKLDDKYEIKPVDLSHMKNDDEVLGVFSAIQSDYSFLLDEFRPEVFSLLVQMKEADKKKFYKQLDDRYGLSLAGILEKENIKDSFALAVEQNLDLIKSLSEKQLNRVKNVVLSDLRAGSFDAHSIREMLIHEFGVTTRHAEFIARDQSHKMTSTLDALRVQNLGCTKYIWRTAKDRRVRGDPTGKYPNARPSHYAREGKTFTYAKPPEGGNPGEDYNCRCYAESILPDDIAELIPKRT